MNTDFLIIGGGIFGLSAALELRQRQFSVRLINPDGIPHPLAASTDISKIVRAEYGADQQYFEMAMAAIAGWEHWNQLLGRAVYHPVGLLMLMREDRQAAAQDFERQSVALLEAAGISPQWLSAADLRERYPVVNADFFPYGHFNQRAGYVESRLAIELLAAYAKKQGVLIEEQQTAQDLIIKSGQLVEVKTMEGATFGAGQTIVAAGADTARLVPGLATSLRITGHPVFHFRPIDPEGFFVGQLPVFTADISNTGWYGFPYHPREGVVKIARHSDGLLIDPERDDRQVNAAELSDCRSFLAKAFPELATASLTATRRCLYTDSLDGHFWIDQHPEIRGLSVATGGSGHAMKMGPILGDLVADMAMEVAHPWLERFRWRSLTAATQQEEAARCKLS